MVIRLVSRLLKSIFKGLDYLTPLVDLIVRCWIAYIFFKAGLTKVENWQGTVMLFTYEYHVPLLSPYLAAILSTASELILPILLALGFGSRIMIFIFFIYNAVAVLSYPFFWTPDGAAGLDQHINWGLLLALLMTHGPGKWSMDNWIRNQYGYHLE